MTKKISTFIFLGLILTIIFWTLDKESVVTIDWRNYNAVLSVPELMVVVLFAIVVLDLLNRWFRHLLKLQVKEVYHSSLLDNNDGQEGEAIDVLAGKISEKIIIDRKDFDRSLLMVLKTMTATTSGDMKEARRNIKQLKTLIGEDPILDVLMMKIYKGERNYDKMEKLSEKLIRNADMQIVGMKAAVEAQMEKKEFKIALATANRAFELRQDLYWIIESAFELRAKSADWEGALQVLEAGRKKKIIPEIKFQRMNAMVLFERSKECLVNDDEVNFFKYCTKAIAADDTLVPAAIELARYYVKNDNQVRKAENVLIAAWKKNPTDTIAYEYLAMHPKDNPREKIQRLDHLVNTNAMRASLNNRLIAEYSAAGGFWNKAKAEVEMFLINNPCTKKICKIIIGIEKEVNKDRKEIKAWEERYEHCADDSRWVCEACGKSFEQWSAVCPECQAFGQEDWHLYVENNKHEIVDEIDDEEEEE